MERISEHGEGCSEQLEGITPTKTAEREQEKGRSSQVN